MQNTNNLLLAVQVTQNTTVDTTSVPLIRNCEEQLRTQNIPSVVNTSSTRYQELLVFNSTLVFVSLDNVTQQLELFAQAQQYTGLRYNHSAGFYNTEIFNYTLQSIVIGNQPLYYLWFPTASTTVQNTTNVLSINISDVIYSNALFFSTLPIFDNAAIKVNSGPSGIDLITRLYDNIYMNWISTLTMNTNDILAVVRELTISF